MLRFPNPGSDIGGFIRIFQALYDELCESPGISLDDISKTLVQRNLATSSGYMGHEALELSTRPNRSRDPLYNQSKSYSELYRLLGWMHPLPESRLTFTFTFLGRHVASARRDFQAIFRESVLGIAYPSPHLDVTNSPNLRPFASILRLASALGGVVSRDEIIIGVLNLANDTDSNSIKTQAEHIKTLRGDYRRLQTATESDFRRTKYHAGHNA